MASRVEDLVDHVTDHTDPDSSLIPMRGFPDRLENMAREVLIDEFDRAYGVEKYNEEKRVEEIENYIQINMDDYDPDEEDELIEKAREHAEKMPSLEDLGLSNLLTLAVNKLKITKREVWNMILMELPSDASEAILKAVIEGKNSIPDPDEMKVPPESQDYIDEVLDVVDRSPMKVVEEPDLRTFYDALVLGYRDMEFGLSKGQLNNIKALKSLGRYIEDTYEMARELLDKKRQSGTIFYSTIDGYIDRICKYCKGRRLIHSVIVEYLKDQGLRVHS